MGWVMLGTNAYSSISTNEYVLFQVNGAIFSIGSMLIAVIYILFWRELTPKLHEGILLINILLALYLTFTIQMVISRKVVIIVLFLFFIMLMSLKSKLGAGLQLFVKGLGYILDTVIIITFIIMQFSLNILTYIIQKESSLLVGFLNFIIIGYLFMYIGARVMPILFLLFGEKKGTIPESIGKTELINRIYIDFHFSLAWILLISFILGFLASQFFFFSGVLPPIMVVNILVVITDLFVNNIIEKNSTG